jgi:hypothetical protein
MDWVARLVGLLGQIFEVKLEHNRLAAHLASEGASREELLS